MCSICMISFLICWWLSKAKRYSDFSLFNLCISAYSSSSMTSLSSAPERSICFSSSASRHLSISFFWRFTRESTSLSSSFLALRSSLFCWKASSNCLPSFSLNSRKASCRSGARESSTRLSDASRRGSAADWPSAGTSSPSIPSTGGLAPAAARPTLNPWPASSSPTPVADPRCPVPSAATSSPSPCACGIAGRSATCDFIWWYSLKNTSKLSCTFRTDETSILLFALSLKKALISSSSSLLSSGVNSSY
mmetsp:Transcript_41225/g.89868  ORF Transcript_41225/g.89868 Transcript_41225/m.89868 type:complete len:250 (+) Transcript_41225:347-1096(+)